MSPSRRFGWLHPWDREKPMRDKVDRDVRAVAAEVRARAQESLARHQTRPFASVDVTTGENVKRDERENRG